MDQCEDREEGVPPSKSTLCGEHESQTKAQRNPPGPPPSCVSCKSDRSKDHIIDFKVSAAERINGRPAGPDPGPSCVSCKSDWSKDEPYSFKVQPVSDVDRLTEVHKKMMMEEEEDRAESAGCSCPSVRSDRSKGRPPAFSGEPGPTRGQRSQSAGSSCPSVRSDWSKGNNPDFSGEPGRTSLRGHKESHRRPNPAVDSTAVCAGVPATGRLFNLVQSVKGPTHERHTLDLVLSGGLTLCDTEIDNINSLTTCL